MQVLCVFTLLVALAPGSQTPAPKPASQTPAPKPASQTPAAPAAAAKGARTVELTGGDDMKYNTTTINAKPGETLHVVLKSTGTVPKIAMAHNFVLLKLGSDVDAFLKSAMNARETDYVPADQKAQVVASTKLAGPGETVEVTFKVPAKAGTYPYMCTFPGHYTAGMKGQLVVQ
jgi:azurin